MTIFQIEKDEDPEVAHERLTKEAFYDALSQLIVTKYHTIDDARSTLGNLAVIRTGFATLQKKVYAA